MGFKLAVNLYADRSAEQVVAAYRRFYQTHVGCSRPSSYHFVECDDGLPLQVYDFSPHWTLVDAHLQPEDWLRERHLAISADLGCCGFFVFEDDGDYWGYEFFSKGQVLDHFTSRAGDKLYFDGFNCEGNAQVISQALPGLTQDMVRPYLARLPDWDTLSLEEYDHIKQTTDGYARPGDRVTRWRETAVLNFLGMLGIQSEFRNSRLFYLAPLHAEISAQTPS